MKEPNANLDKGGLTGLLVVAQRGTSLTEHISQVGQSSAGAQLAIYQQRANLEQKHFESKLNSLFKQH